jgi:hypothetical protein
VRVTTAQRAKSADNSELSVVKSLTSVDASTQFVSSTDLKKEVREGGHKVRQQDGSRQG